MVGVPLVGKLRSGDCRYSVWKRRRGSEGEERNDVVSYDVRMFCFGRVVGGQDCSLESRSVKRILGLYLLT